MPEEYDLEPRMDIAKKMRYMPDSPASSRYVVRWKGETFYSHDTGDLITQVEEWEDVRVRTS